MSLRRPYKNTTPYIPSTKPTSLSTRPPVPYKKEFLPPATTPKILKRDKNDQPYRDCDSEPEEKVLHPDVTPIFKVDYRESLSSREKVISNYVCELGQSYRDKEVEDWMKEHPHLADTSRKVISEKTHKWLQEFISGKYQMGKLEVITTMDPEIKAELQQFRYSRPVKAYRGIHFNIHNIDRIQNMCIDKIKPNYYYHYKDDRVSSWTWNYKIAEHFAKLSNFNFNLQHTFHPKDILIDCRLLHEYCNLRNATHPQNQDFTMSQIQDEIIILPGDYQCEVKNAPFNKNALLSTITIPALRKLWREYMENTVTTPGVLSYGGNAQGLYGMITKHVMRHSTGKNEIIYLLYDFQRNGDEYVLKFGIMPPSTVRNIVPNSETTYSVPSYDSFFYETVNKKMKYMKHDENATKISAHIYKVGHEKCKDICDKNYRMELVEIESPYEIRSESLMELVSMFIEDATRFPTIVL